MKAGGVATYTVPKCIPAGNYLVRHEIIALHSAYSYTRTPVPSSTPAATSSRLLAAAASRHLVSLRSPAPTRAPMLASLTMRTRPRLTLFLDRRCSLARCSLNVDDGGREMSFVVDIHFVYMVLNGIHASAITY